ncbi:RDD family protein [Luteirhabdus pelagi]|uniref:RDD family protein n=1 Tax=Luteirhabdus pelagi TaxID=2792783 RepID=UPI00193A0684|nr:RDD family protein [Luteirhabdus pelagi]
MKKIKTEPNLSNRFVAGFIDYLIIYGVTFTLAYTIGEPNGEGGYSLNGLPALLPVTFWLIMTVGIEIGYGATLGNSIVGLKPIPKSGTIRKLTFGESLKRHLLDPIDMFLFGLIGIITIKNTDLNQRVGDLWAKTIVISNKSLNDIKSE